MNEIRLTKSNPAGTILLILGGIMISMVVFALLPLLLRQTSFSRDLSLNQSALLVPLEQKQFLEPLRDLEEPEPEPPPPPEPVEPELETEPPELTEIEPPEIEMPEVQPPEVDLEPVEMNPLPDMDLRIDTPSLNALALNSLPTQSSPFNLKVNLKVGRASLPKAMPKPLPKPTVPIKQPGKKTRFNLDEVDRQPVGVSTMQPIYPYRARRMAVEGFVDIKFLVDCNGRTRDLTIVKSEPDGVFEKAVEKALSRWRFKPAVKDGKPVETWVTTTVKFVLKKGS